MQACVLPGLINLIAFGTGATALDSPLATRLGRC